MLTRGLLTPGRPPEFVRFAMWAGRRLATLNDLDIVIADRLDAWQHELGAQGPVVAVGLRPADEALARMLQFLDPALINVSADRAPIASRMVAIRHIRTAHHAASALTAWSEVLLPGGIILLFDGFDERRPHVNDGLLQFLEDSAMVAAINAGQVTVITRPDDAAVYQARLQAALADESAVPWALHTNDFAGSRTLSLRVFDLKWRLDYWRRFTQGRFRRSLPL
jgi:hypothetical protein